jgi:hypothetical protein
MRCLLGFFSVVVSLSLFSSAAFLAHIALYWYALQAYFFHPDRTSNAAFLAGLTLASELLSSQPFGRHIAVTLVFLLLYDIFALRVQFTDRYYRFLIAWAALVAAYLLLLFPTGTLSNRWPSAVGIAGICGLTSLYLTTLKQSQQPEYFKGLS